MTEKKDPDAPEEPENQDESTKSEAEEPETEAQNTDSDAEGAENQSEDEKSDTETSENQSDDDDSDFEEPWDADVDPLAHAEDEIDPELLALADDRPPPKLHRPLIMLVVCVLIAVMMVWFWNDLLYYFAPTTPMDLGEAHDIQFTADMEDRLVRFEGIPLAPRNQGTAPYCGRTQGFPTYQRRFMCRGHHSAIPIAGRENHDLIIQRYVIRQLRISYAALEGQSEDQTRGLVENAAKRVSAVQKIQPTREGEIGKLVAHIEGTAGKTDLSAVAKSIRYQIESTVPGIERVRVERVQRDLPGVFEGRLVKIGALGSRFAAVADYLNECTNFPVNEDTWVLLDGSEAGEGTFDMMGMCYGHQPRQYTPYLVLYGLLGLMLMLNLYLLIKFVSGLRSKQD